ncbi:MAG: hypothetical protein B7Y77_03115, partial [Bradyrhizobium sp. 35-63-5]
HIIVKNDGRFTNVAGRMKADLGCDIRGVGGQFLAPGAWLEDGRKYVSMIGAADLCDSAVLGTLPDMPPEFVDLIGSGGTIDRSSDVVLKERTSTSATETLIREALVDGAMPNGSALLDPVFGFDLKALAASSASVATAIDNAAFGDLDHSAARLSVVTALKSAGATPCEVAAILMAGEYNDICGSYVGHANRNGRIVERKLDAAGGSFNLRNIARDYERAVVRKDHSDLFGAVDDEREAEPEKTGKTMWGYDSHLDYVPMQWAIDGIVPAQGVGVLYGNGNVGKSFAALDMLDHVKRGAQWHGRDTVKGGAMYICAEGQAGLGSRLKALYDERPISSRYES